MIKLQDVFESPILTREEFDGLSDFAKSINRDAWKMSIGKLYAICIIVENDTDKKRLMAKFIELRKKTMKDNPELFRRLMLDNDIKHLKNRIIDNINKNNDIDDLLYIAKELNVKHASNLNRRQRHERIY